MANDATRAFLAKQFAQAEKHCKKIIQIHATDPDANNLLGKIAESRGALDEARSLYLRGHESNPKHLQLLVSLAQLNNKTRAYEAAAKYWQQYLKLKPYSADVWQALSSEWYSLRQWDKAETAARQSLKFAPKRALAHTNLGQTLLQQQRYDEAISCFKASIDIDPNSADAWYSLAVPMLQKGDMDEAFEILNRALALNPHHADSLSRLLRFKKVDSYNDIVKSAESAFNNLSAPPEDRITIGFGLGKAWEDLHEYDKSFAYYAEANRIRQSFMKFDMEHEHKFAEEIKQVFSESFLSQQPDDSKAAGEEFIFIVGMPRCGSTLLAQILASLPNVIDTGETDLLREATGRLTSGDKHQLELQSLLNTPQDSIIEAADQFKEAMTRLFGESEVYVDKALPNFWLIGVIRKLFPKAKIIHCTRDPLDTCFSIFSNLFQGAAFNYTYNLEEIAEYYRIYLDLAEHWRNTLPADAYCEISYESLISAQEEQSRKLIDFCNLEWSDECLSFYKSKQAVQTSSLAQVRQPIYNSSIGRWKRFEKHLQPLIEALGDAV